MQIPVVRCYEILENIQNKIYSKFQGIRVSIILVTLFFNKKTMYINWIV